MLSSGFGLFDTCECCSQSPRGLVHHNMAFNTASLQTKNGLFGRVHVPLAGGSYQVIYGLLELLAVLLVRRGREVPVDRVTIG